MASASPSRVTIILCKITVHWNVASVNVSVYQLSFECDMIIKLSLCLMSNCTMIIDLKASCLYSTHDLLNWI